MTNSTKGNNPQAAETAWLARCIEKKTKLTFWLGVSPNAETSGDSYIGILIALGVYSYIALVDFGSQGEKEVLINKAWVSSIIPK